LGLAGDAGVILKKHSNYAIQMDYLEPFLITMPLKDMHYQKHLQNFI